MRGLCNGGTGLPAMMAAQSTDRMYNCLPMYHSVGGVQVPGAILVAGGTLILREKFSASQFWNDIVRWDCTVFQYIGELLPLPVARPAFCERDRPSHQDGLRQRPGAGSVGRL